MSSPEARIPLKKLALFGAIGAAVIYGVAHSCDNNDSAPEKAEKCVSQPLNHTQRKNVDQLGGAIDGAGFEEVKQLGICKKVNKDLALAAFTARINSHCMLEFKGTTPNDYGLVKINHDKIDSSYGFIQGITEPTFESEAKAEIKDDIVHAKVLEPCVTK